ALIAAAREARERGRPQEAVPLLRQAEMEAPRHPLVLNETAARMLAGGNASGALALLEQGAQAEPASTDILFNLASALKQLERVDEAAERLGRLLVIDQRNLPALLEKGALEELQCKPRDAAMSYRNALQIIPPGLKPPPSLAPRLAHAQRAVEDNNRALEA